MSTLYKNKTSANVGRPVSENTTNFIAYLINYIIDNKHEYQIFLNEITEEYSGNYTLLRTN